MENYEMYDLELEETVADEVFPETNNPYDSENFPTKDRKQAAKLEIPTEYKWTGHDPH